MTAPRLAERPLILGHRGAPLEAPENTFASFRRAIERGADGVELDVQRSADEVPIVIHDLTLDRTTNGRGEVAGLPWRALARLDAGEGEPLRRLREVADWAAGARAWLNVELKTAGIEARTLAVLRRARVLRRTLVSSFLPTAVLEVGRLAPRVKRALVTESWDPIVAGLVRDAGAGGVCIERRLASPALIDELSAAGLFTVVWTVDEQAEIESVLRMGVAAVITNRPERGAAALSAISG